MATVPLVNCLMSSTLLFAMALVVVLYVVEVPFESITINPRPPTVAYPTYKLLLMPASTT